MECSSHHLELFFQARLTIVSWCCNIVEVAVNLSEGHFCLLSQYGFHHSIMDEDILFLEETKQKKLFNSWYK